FDIPDGATVKWWRDGAKVAVDIAQPEAAAAKAGSKPADPKPADAKTADIKPAETKIEADTAAAEPKPAQTQPQAQAQVQPQPQAQSPAQPAASPVPGVPAAAPVTPVHAAQLGTFMPAPPTGPISGEPLVPGVDSSRTGPLLHFPWTRPVAAAAFLRHGYLWLVFDRAAAVDLRPITTREWNGAINGVEQLPIQG